MTLTPSMLALIATGLLIFVSLIVSIKNIRTIMKSGYYIQVKIVLMFAIAIGIHGLLHLGAETNYGFNPLR